MVDCSGRLVMEAFCGSDRFVIDVKQPHGCPQSYKPNSIERLLEVHEDVLAFVKSERKSENGAVCNSVLDITDPWPR